MDIVVDGVVNVVLRRVHKTDGREVYVQSGCLSGQQEVILRIW